MKSPSCRLFSLPFPFLCLLHTLTLFSYRAHLPWVGPGTFFTQISSTVKGVKLLIMGRLVTAKKKKNFLRTEVASASTIRPLPDILRV